MKYHQHSTSNLIQSTHFYRELLHHLARTELLGPLRLKLPICATRRVANPVAIAAMLASFSSESFWMPSISTTHSDSPARLHTVSSMARAAPGEREGRGRREGDALNGVVSAHEEARRRGAWAEKGRKTKDAPAGLNVGHGWGERGTKSSCLGGPPISRHAHDSCVEPSPMPHFLKDWPMIYFSCLHANAADKA